MTENRNRNVKHPPAPAIAAVALIAIVVAIGFAWASTEAADPSPSSPPAASPTRSPSPSPSASPSPSPTASRSPTPSPSPAPTAAEVPAPLSGVIVPRADAARRPIVVMVDDHPGARPQSGFTQASVVWHAPAEYGIPRYMLVYGEALPGSVGGVRSARDYFIAWAAEWTPLYAHVGGSPTARRTLRQQGDGQLVYDADEYDYKPYYWRVPQFPIPHNMYTDGEQLRALADDIGAADHPLDAIPEPVWEFAPDLPRGQRPTGGSIAVAFPANAVRYDYDADTNRYLRSVAGGRRHVDAATGERVAPKNVVVMLVDFGSLNDGSGTGRLEADVIGSGPAWIATNGTTVKGTWRKASLTAPTQFFDAAGDPVTFTAGQTFIQVMPTGSRVRIQDGVAP